MSGIRNKSGSANSRRKRVIKVAPMTRAVRVALAASLAALALGASGGAFAAPCKTPAVELMPCTSAVTDATPVLDLTLVHGVSGPSGHGAFIMPTLISVSDPGDVVIDNSTPISESGSGLQLGIYGRSYYGDVDITNQPGADIEVSSSDFIAAGIVGFAPNGSVGIDNSADIMAYGAYGAFGIVAASYSGAGVVNSGDVSAFSKYGSATGIAAQAAYYGDAGVQNSGDILAVSLQGNATGIQSYAAYGNAGIENSGNVYAASVYGSAIGLYAYSYIGDASVDNSGYINAGSYFGLADGIFASGVNADVSNSGDISAVSAYGSWAAGIEAQADDMTTVDNSGNIYASATYGAAYGIYATGDMVDVSNSGDIDAQGYYATGIEAQGGSSAVVTNAGDINAGALEFTTTGYYYYGNYYSYTYLSGGTAVATGINASANYPSGEASVTNSGDISAVSIYGSTGIAATSTGTGGTASVTNSGSVYANQYNKYGYGGYGIVASADGDATIDNSGAITVVSGGAASGATALSFAGNASVTNSGDISVESTAALGYGAYGIVSFAQNGDAYAGNSGNVSATGKYLAAAVDAAGFGDVTVDNSGSLYANGSKYAFGVRAYAGTGDVMVANHEGGSIEAYSYNGRSFGVLGVAYQGDVGVDNAGSIYAYGYGQTVGVFGVALEGDTTITNSGDITAITGGSAAVGIFARSDYGTSTVDNSGDIVATVEGVNGFIGDVAYGIIARGEYSDVSNSGNIDVTGYYYATGIAASSYYGTTVNNTGGSINVYAVGGATGIAATSAYGDVGVSNASDISALGLVFGATGIQTYAYGNVEIDNSGDMYVASLYGNAIGIYGYSIAGDSSIGNSGDITAVSFYGLADGIFASGVNADVSNSGDLTAVSVTGYWAAGIEAQADDTTTVDNSGNIYASATYGVAYGIYATGDVVEVSNSGSIEAQGYYATGIEAQGGSSVTITNDGDIVAGSVGVYYNPYTYNTYVYGSAIGTGINATSNYEDGAITVTNNGTVAGVGYFGGTGIAATATGTGGSASVINNGGIYASQYSKYGYGAYGIVVSADGDATIENSATGSITVDSGGLAMGAAALSFAGDASVTNAGDISVSGDALLSYGAYGILSFAQNGSAYASNSGHIDATTKYIGAGIDASGLEGATVNNSGDIEVDAWRAYGIRANSGLGDVSVSNSGSISAIYSYGLFSGTAFGILASSTAGDVSIDNSGEIYTSVTGQSVGIFGISSYGDVAVTNSGNIGSYTYASTAVGIFARANYGSASVDNSGSINVDAYYGNAFGILARSEYTNVSNSGDISATGFYSATGIAANSYYGTSVVNTASGSIDAYALGEATGISASSSYGDAVATNAGSIDAVGIYYGGAGISASSIFYDATASNSGLISASSIYGNVAGIHADSLFGDAFASNSGQVDAASVLANAIGIYSSSVFGDAHAANSGTVVSSSLYGSATGVASIAAYGTAFATNSGMIEATGYYGDAVGMQAAGAHAQATNSGHIDVYGYYSATGIAAFSYYGTMVTNSGDIYAASPDGSARGIYAYAMYGNVVINNSGDVVASSDVDAAAVEMGAVTGTATLNNSGTLSVDAPLDGQVAVLGSDGVEIINNTGDIYGSLVLLGGNDRLNNNNGGVWHVFNQSTDFGDGNDVIVNNAGGLIEMTDGAIHMGAGSDNILNLGVITVAGDNLIDLGSSSNDILTNVNLISFLDGHADDALHVIGSVGSTGALSLDVDLASHSSDQLSVTGNMTANAAQRVNILFDGMPLTAHTSIDFAHVSGTSVAGSFVPGQILSYNYPRNFIDLRFGIGSSINAANTSADVFSIDLDVAGLLDSGTIAANVATGAAGMLNAQIGTLRQRIGVNPYGDPSKVMSAFVRFYSSEGDVSPDHVAANFGQGGNFDYNLNTWGREVGINANLFEGFHAGITIGSADGRQRLTGAGIGQNRMDGMTWGAYATWYAPQGFYLDLSGRWMAVDVESTSAAGVAQGGAHTGATNLEVGYPWTTSGGLVITPQLQYTRTKVDGIRTFYGDRANFEGHGGTSTRGRLGLEFSKTFQTSGGMSVTPFGSLNAVRESGDMNYTVADNFFGTTSTKGTSSMLDLGIGLEKGRFAVTAGANWIDGGAFNSVIGGQLVVRYAW